MNLNVPLNRLMQYIAQRGLRDATKLIPAESTRQEEPHAPVHLNSGHLQLHLFGANFPSQAQADAFCTTTAGTNLPRKLTQELDGAFIDEAGSRLSMATFRPEGLSLLVRLDYMLTRRRTSRLWLERRSGSVWTASLIYGWRPL
jgi:hypothetical protein